MRQSEKNLLRALSLIKDYFSPSEIKKTKGVTEELILEIEKILNVKLPFSYRVFLNLMGFGGPESLIVNGIISTNLKDIKKTGIVYGTIIDREKCKIPEHIIILDDVGNGESYALDLSQMNEENECPVVIWPLNGYEDMPDLEIVAPDFGTWFLKEVKLRIEWKSEKNKQMRQLN